MARDLTSPALTNREDADHMWVILCDRTDRGCIGEETSIEGGYRSLPEAEQEAARLNAIAERRYRERPGGSTAHYRVTTIPVYRIEVQP